MRDSFTNKLQNTERNILHNTRLNYNKIKLQQDIIINKLDELSQEVYLNKNNICNVLKILEDEEDAENDNTVQ